MILQEKKYCELQREEKNLRKSNTKIPPPKMKNLKIG